MKKTAFSLMETMTLLLIISLVAAATVPLVTKRTLSESHGWYACYYTVDNAGVAQDNMLREIRVENKTETTAQQMIDHEVRECIFNFPAGNPKPKVFTITAIGAGANLSAQERAATLIDNSGVANYLDSDPEARKHRILSDVWGFLMNPVMVNTAACNPNDRCVHPGPDGDLDTVDDNIETLPTGRYGARFGIVDAECDGERYTFCTPTAGQYVRSVYRLNDGDPNEMQRLTIQIGRIGAGNFFHGKQANHPESPEAMRTVVSDMRGPIVTAQGGYRYKNSNGITKIIVPPYNELACKMDGVKLCSQVDGCTMNDYRNCMDNGFIADNNFLTDLAGTYPMQNSSFWLSNRLIHTPGLFDGQPEYEAFNNIYHTGLPDAGCDDAGNCQFINRRLAFGDPTLVWFEKSGTNNTSGDAFQNIIDGNAVINIPNTYLNGSVRREQNARTGMVFITW